jgi:hypothetical protein
MQIARRIAGHPRLIPTALLAALGAVPSCKGSDASGKRPAASEPAAPSAALTAGTASAEPATAPPPTEPAPADAAPAAAQEQESDEERAALEPIVRPFLGEEVDTSIMRTGPFGPAPETIVVITFTGAGRGDFSGFALVPDREARSGYRKLPMPWLPSGSMSGDMEFAVIDNLDRDPALELVVETRVTRTVEGAEGGYSYDASEFVALDWDAPHKKFVRMAPIERKLKEAFADEADLPTSDDVHKALGLVP